MGNVIESRRCLLMGGVVAFVVVAAGVFLGATSASALDFYVAADGRDTWSGRSATTDPDTKDGPFATLDRARDEIRKFKRDAKGLREPVVEVESLDEWQSLQAAGFDRNSVVADPLFVASEKDDWRLRPESPAFKLGFQPIPVEKIGPYRDPLRASWPIVEAAGAREWLVNSAAKP